MALTGSTGAVSTLPGDPIDLYLGIDGGSSQQTLAVTRVGRLATAVDSAGVPTRADD